MRAFPHTDLVPQHALQPVLSCAGDVDVESVPAVDHGHRGARQQVIRQLDDDLTTGQEPELQQTGQAAHLHLILEIHPLRSDLRFYKQTGGCFSQTSDSI